MKYGTAVLALIAASMLAGAVAHATPMTFVGTFTQALEVPPTGSPGTGGVVVVLDPAANTLFVDETFSGLVAGTTASHIHCCLASPFETGVNVGVATTVPTFPGFPLGVTSGTYTHTLDLTQASSYNPAFITAEGGTVSDAEMALIAGIEDGKSYVNIHTTEFPTGEIRTFLTPAPEPGSLVLLGSAIFGFGLIRRRIPAMRRMFRRA